MKKQAKKEKRNENQKSDFDGNKRQTDISVHGFYNTIKIHSELR